MFPRRVVVLCLLSVLASVFCVLPALASDAAPASAAQSDSAVAYDNSTGAGNLKLATSIAENGERNYIMGLPSGSGFDPLLFEGNISPNYFIFSRRGVNTRDLWHLLKFLGYQDDDAPDHRLPWLLVVVPKINLRMLHAYSQPVQSPSFMPRLDFYYHLRNKGGLVDSAQTEDYFLFRLSHHSNGQIGSYISPVTGQVDRAFGSWATNFIEIGLSRRFGLFEILKQVAPFLGTQYDEQLSVELHPKPGAGGRDPDATRGYASTRYHWSERFLLHQWEPAHGSAPDVSSYDKVGDQAWFAVDATYLVGVMQRRFAASRRMVWHGQLVWRYGGPGDTALFADFYSGQDYANIAYDRYLKRVAVGIMLWPRQGRW